MRDWQDDEVRFFRVTIASHYHGEECRSVIDARSEAEYLVRQGVPIGLIEIDEVVPAAVRRTLALRPADSKS